MLVPDAAVVGRSGRRLACPSARLDQDLIPRPARQTDSRGGTPGVPHRRAACRSLRVKCFLFFLSARLTFWIDNGNVSRGTISHISTMQTYGVTCKEYFIFSMLFSPFWMNTQNLLYFWIASE